jgi:hypothetical protein
MSVAPAPGADVVYRDPLRQARLRKKAWTNALIGIASLIGFAVLLVVRCLFPGRHFRVLVERPDLPYR